MPRGDGANSFFYIRSQEGEPYRAGPRLHDPIAQAGLGVGAGRGEERCWLLTQVIAEACLTAGKVCPLSLCFQSSWGAPTDEMYACPSMLERSSIPVALRIG